MVSNAPGDDARALLEYFNDALWNDQGTEALADDTLTAVGAMRTAYDPFGDVNGTIGEWFRNQVWADYLDELALNGQLSRELAEWRFNLIANYTFTEGRLKGWGFGTSYRWEDERAIGYNYMFNEVGNVVPNVSAPMYSPTNDRIDFNINYRTSLNERFDWKIEMNIFNAFGDDELRPVTANPDGSFSGYRIQEGRSWRITSTITF